RCVRGPRAAAAARGAPPACRALPRRPRPDVPRGRGVPRVRTRGRPAAMSLLLALPLLGIARLLPDHGFGLWVRLAAATLVVLIPGRLASRALRVRGPSAALAWSLALV